MHVKVVLNVKNSPSSDSKDITLTKEISQELKLFSGII